MGMLFMWCARRAMFCMLATIRALVLALSHKLPPFLGSNKFIGMCVKRGVERVFLHGQGWRLKRSAQCACRSAVRAQCNYLGVWP